MIFFKEKMDFLSFLVLQLYFPTFAIHNQSLNRILINQNKL